MKTGLSGQSIPEFDKFGIMIFALRGNRVHVGTGPWTKEQG